jgi:Leucine-rich repeat (LRR) protein
VELAYVAPLTNLLVLTVYAPPQLDLAPLRSLGQLRRLFLSELGFPTSTPRNLQLIGELRELRSLELVGFKITDVNFVGALKQLEQINLNNTSSLKSIAALEGLKSLRILSLQNTQVDDITPLLKLSLTDLYIAGTPARADVVAELRRNGVRVWE